MCAAKSEIEEQSKDDLLCPLRYMLDIFGGKWKQPIICMLASGMPKRYSTIQRKLGNITNVMLAQSLKELEAAGIINREQYNEVPPRVEYSLTDKGKTIIPLLMQAAEWAVADMQKETACGAKCDKCQTVT